MIHAGWLAVPIDEGSAVIPLDDDIVHDVHGSPDCVCEPEVVPVVHRGNFGVMYVHQALDGRVDDE